MRYSLLHNNLKKLSHLRVCLCRSVLYFEYTVIFLQNQELECSESEAQVVTKNSGCCYETKDAEMPEESDIDDIDAHDEDDDEIPEDDSDTNPDWASTEEEARDSLEDDDEETDSMSSNYIR